MSQVHEIEMSGATAEIDRPAPVQPTGATAQPAGTGGTDSERNLVDLDAAILNVKRR
jgi:hypothetical protein